ncbi:ABC transporter substrate-binding protein [Microbacteriaceae bacterium K1510]|nr:ABC transporter substrate-binding protein [Microbacteriaceae bacterium K1510]
MTIEIERRTLLQMLAASVAGGSALLDSAVVLAQTADAVTIGWPSDVPSWDPNQRFSPDSQPMFKLVFDQPIDQDTKLNLIPKLVKKWEFSPDGLSLAVELRDDVTFHNGDKMTAEDFRYTFFERIKAGHAVDTKNSYRKVTDIVVESPTKATIKLSSPSPTLPNWMAFLGSYVVPKKYLEEVGVEKFREKPVGTGPYKLVEYQLNARIVLERNESYWGPKPKLKRITFEIIKDPSARVAAIQSGQVDLTINVPVREVTRLQREPNLAGEINPVTRVILLQCRNDEGFADANIRLAAHHAIDKAALSKAFYGGAAVPVSLPVSPGSSGDVPGYKFSYDPELAKQLLAKSGYNVDKPAKLRLGTTNGHFPSDYDVARAIQQMWKKVGIDAEIETIEYAKYFELNRAAKLPDVTLYSWDNASGDPEIFAGFLLSPTMPFSAWKDQTLGATISKLMATTDEKARIEGWKDLAKTAVEMGASIPVLQTVITVVRKKKLSYDKYANGWILGNTMSWS